MISSVVKSSWNCSFSDFRDMGLILPEAVTGSVLQKRYPSKFRNIHRKTPVPESLFIKLAGLAQVKVLRTFLQNNFG